MNRDAKRALRTIQQCVEADRFQVLKHFRDRLAERNMLWVDVLAMLEEPGDVRDDGVDDYGREKWVLVGEGADGLPIECVCVLDSDDEGEMTVFFTLYFDE